MDRKNIIRKYKQTSLPAGVYRVRNNVKGKSLIGASVNVPGILNRHRFQLEHGSHSDRELQKDWNEFGPDAFAFVFLDQLEPADAVDYDASEELHVLLQMWLEKFRDSNELLYLDFRVS